MTIIIIIIIISFPRCSLRYACIGETYLSIAERFTYVETNSASASSSDNDTNNDSINNNEFD